MSSELVNQIRSAASERASSKADASQERDVARNLLVAELAAQAIREQYLIPEQTTVNVTVTGDYQVTGVGWDVTQLLKSLVKGEVRINDFRLRADIVVWNVTPGDLAEGQSGSSIKVTLRGARFGSRRLRTPEALAGWMDRQ